MTTARRRYTEQDGAARGDREDLLARAIDAERETPALRRKRQREQRREALRLLERDVQKFCGAKFRKHFGRLWNPAWNAQIADRMKVAKPLVAAQEASRGARKPSVRSVLVFMWDHYGPIVVDNPSKSFTVPKVAKTATQDERAMAFRAAYDAWSKELASAPARRVVRLAPPSFYIAAYGIRVHLLREEPRALSVDEYTWISLLLGNRPKLRKRIVPSCREVVAAERQAIGLALKRHGRRPLVTREVDEAAWDPETWDPEKNDTAEYPPTKVVKWPIRRGMRAKKSSAV